MKQPCPPFRNLRSRGTLLQLEHRAPRWKVNLPGIPASKRSNQTASATNPQDLALKTVISLLPEKRLVKLAT
jgi:hypothetical protein